jgi:hypothetical protein
MEVSVYLTLAGTRLSGENVVASISCLANGFGLMLIYTILNLHEFSPTTFWRTRALRVG